MPNSTPGGTVGVCPARSPRNRRPGHPSPDLRYSDSRGAGAPDPELFLRKPLRSDVLILSVTRLFGFHHDSARSDDGL
jgi:hypothetical protein